MEHLEQADSSKRVEEGWQRVRDDGRVRPELLEAAYAEPRLRVPFPWTGMGELHFSRCTETRWTWDIHLSRGERHLLDSRAVAERVCRPG